MPPNLGNLVGQPLNQATLHQARQQIQAGVREAQMTGNIGETVIYGGGGGTISYSTAATNSYTIDVWPVWNELYFHAATSATTTGITMAANTTATAVWRDWNQTYTIDCGTCITASTNDWTLTATNAVTTAAWTVWNDRYERINDAIQYVGQVQRYSRRQLSEEELLVELEREKRLRQEAEERARQACQAKQRAEDLLRSCLSPQQLEDLNKKNCFYIEIDAADGKKERYRIDRGAHNNVKQIDARGSIMRHFCIQPPGVPDGDAMLAQKLFLESSEEARTHFWETANITEMMKEKAVPNHIPRAQRRKYAVEHGLLH